MSLSDVEPIDNAQFFERYSKEQACYEAVEKVIEELVSKDPESLVPREPFAVLAEVIERQDQVDIKTKQEYCESCARNIINGLKDDTYQK